MTIEFDQTPQEKCNVVKEALRKLEDNFAAVGELLAAIKQSRIWSSQYTSFREYLQHDLHLNVAMANRFIRFYELYQVELDIDQEELKKIGYDRLSIITPAIQGAKEEDQQFLLEKAKELPSDELADVVKTYRAKEKKLSVKDVMADQFVESFTTKFNCSKKEMLFKLALYFNYLAENKISPRELIELRKRHKPLAKALKYQDNPDTLEKAVETYLMPFDIESFDDELRLDIKLAQHKFEEQMQRVEQDTVPAKPVAKDSDLSKVETTDPGVSAPSPDVTGDSAPEESNE